MKKTDPASSTRSDKRGLSDNNNRLLGIVNSYDGDTMAGSSCEGEQKRGGTNKRTIAEFGLSIRFTCF